MFDVTDYHRTLDTITTAPLTLSERDFDVLQEFGGPDEEQRGREAMRAAQLALVMPATPLQTKAAAPSASRRSSWPAPERLADMTATAIRQVVVPLRQQLSDQQAALADLRQQLAAQAATITSLGDEVKALGGLVTRDLAPPRRAPSLDDVSSRTSPKH